MGPRDEGMRALRQSVAWAPTGHVSCVRISGNGAFELVDRICTSELYLRDTQILATLLLNDDGSVFADLLLCRDDEDFILLAEGCSGAELSSWIRSAAPPGVSCALEDLGEEHRLLSVHGPYAWELMGETLGAEIIGLPYLSFMHTAHGTCFRTGKTGEYGYDLMLPAGALDPMFERIEHVGAAFDGCEIGLRELDQAALENWFFNIRREGAVGATPLELQLQWRLSYRKSFPGSTALTVQRAAKPLMRLTMMVSPESIAAGDAVRFCDRRIGTVVNSGWSITFEGFVGLALVERPYAAPGVTRYRVVSHGREVQVRTISPPLLNNRSLFVSPQLHSYVVRNDYLFPALVP